MDRTFNRIMNDRKSLMKCGTQLMVGELGVSSSVASGRINVPGQGEDGSGTSDRYPHKHKAPSLDLSSQSFKE
jgi:hypothetical protein